VAIPYFFGQDQPENVPRSASKCQTAELSRLEEESEVIEEGVRSEADAVDIPTKVEGSTKPKGVAPTKRYKVDSPTYKIQKQRTSFSEDDYIEMCRLFCGKTRYRLQPDVFHIKGDF
jgi:hypothetical protein